MIDDLLLLSGNDLPFPEAQLIIHQPRLREIAYITEQKFWTGCELLKFNKETLPDEDKFGLFNRSNFNIIMTMIQEKNLESRQARVNVLSILTLLFPTSEISLLGTQAIQLRDHQTGEVKEINEENFATFKEILTSMFCLNDSNKQYNPSGELAKKIANKFKKGQEKRAKLAPDTKVTIFSRYISILAVGLQKDINDLMNYTVYQLMDEFNRYNLKMNYDTWERYKIAGASGLEDPQYWLDDIH